MKYEFPFLIKKNSKRRNQFFYLNWLQVFKVISLLYVLDLLQIVNYLVFLILTELVFLNDKVADL